MFIRDLIQEERLTRNCCLESSRLRSINCLAIIFVILNEWYTKKPYICAVIKAEWRRRLFVIYVVEITYKGTRKKKQ